MRTVLNWSSYCVHWKGISEKERIETAKLNCDFLPECKLRNWIAISYLNVETALPFLRCVHKNIVVNLDPQVCGPIRRWFVIGPEWRFFFGRIFIQFHCFFGAVEVNWPQATQRWVHSENYCLINIKTARDLHTLNWNFWWFAPKVRANFASLSSSIRDTFCALVEISYSL